MSSFVPRSKVIAPVAALAATLGLLALGACDPNVETFRDTDRHYSIFGVLDASADTQTIRVERLRDGKLYGAPSSLDAEVLLTNLSTGETVALRDSFIRFSERTSAHNYYTTTDISPSTPYRLVVAGPEEAQSRARTTVPDSFPPPIVMRSAEQPTCSRYNTSSAVVEVSGIDRLIAAKAIYHTAPSGVWTFNYLQSVERSGEGPTRIRVNPSDDLCEIPPAADGPRTPTRIAVMLAAGASDWPEFAGLDLETETLPGTASNVEGGVGLLGGIVSDTVVVYRR